eukprot:3904611-Alexandrium_andersonii.AAC.1
MRRRLRLNCRFFFTFPRGLTRASGGRRERRFRNSIAIRRSSEARRAVGSANERARLWVAPND